MYLLYRIVYAAIVTALHEIIDLKHWSPQFRLYPLNVLHSANFIDLVIEDEMCDIK